MELHGFPEHKSKHWIKPGSKLVFRFVDILELKVLQKGILDVSITQ